VTDVRNPFFIESQPFLRPDDCFWGYEQSPVYNLLKTICAIDLFIGYHLPIFVNGKRS
jgi:hypothetical protein